MSCPASRSSCLMLMSGTPPSAPHIFFWLSRDPLTVMLWVMNASRKTKEKNQSVYEKDSREAFGTQYYHSFSNTCRNINHVCFRLITTSSMKQKISLQLMISPNLKRVMTPGANVVVTLQGASYVMLHTDVVMSYDAALHLGSTKHFTLHSPGVASC